MGNIKRQAGRGCPPISQSNVVRLEDYRKAPQPLWKQPGYIDNRLSTWRETNAWKALAAKHEAARTFVNDLVAAGRGPGTWEYADALDDYRVACGLVLGYRDAKPRNLASIIRCAAELAGLPDPARNHVGGRNYSREGTTEGKFATLLSAIYVRAVFISSS